MRKYLIFIALAAAVSCGERASSIDMERLSLIDSCVNVSIAAGEIPGAVVGIVHDGELVYGKAFGYKSVYPQKDTMTLETMFDMASLTKCISTTISVMQQVERGKIRLMDPVKFYIPDFQPWEDPDTHEKVNITVRDLLTHASGLEAYLPDVEGYVKEFGENSPDSLEMYICKRIKRKFRPGTQQLYSCLNFITLQRILEKVTDQRLCDYAQKNVFDALGLQHTCYFPPAELCAPTEMQPDSSVLRGQVHDPIARRIMGGNSGNAGVFSNLEDLSVIASALLSDGSWNGKRILSPLTVKKMFEVPLANDPSVARSLGWDTYYLEPYSSGDIFPLEDLRGHTGYTGTSMILSPSTNTAVIVLAHRVHPHDEGSIARLRALIATIAASAVM